MREQRTEGAQRNTAPGGAVRSIDAVAVQLHMQRTAGDAKNARRLPTIAAGEAQGSHDLAALHLLDGDRYGTYLGRQRREQRTTIQFGHREVGNERRDSGFGHGGTRRSTVRRCSDGIPGPAQHRGQTRGTLAASDYQQFITHD